MIIVIGIVMIISGRGDFICDGWGVGLIVSWALQPHHEPDLTHIFKFVALQFCWAVVALQFC